MAICFSRPQPAMICCHSAIERRYFFSMAGKYEAGPCFGHGGACGVEAAAGSARTARHVARLRPALPDAATPTTRPPLCGMCVRLHTCSERATSPLSPHACTTHNRLDQVLIQRAVRPPVCPLNQVGDTCDVAREGRNLAITCSSCQQGRPRQCLRTGPQEEVVSCGGFPG
jgi:hypothetical protein